MFKGPARFLLLLAVIQAPIPAFAGEEGGISVWLTSDLQGYLVGCDCPTGVSAGLSAIRFFLSGRTSGDFLLDAGGFREPHRRDELLEEYLDDAARLVGYDAMLAGPADLRDGIGAVRGRAEEVPLTVAAGYRRAWPGRRLPGEKRAAILGSGSERLAVAVHDDSDPGRGFSGCRLEDALGALEASGAAFRLLVYRGGLSALAEGLSTAAGRDSGKPDLVVLTGPEAPGAAAAAGAMTGILEAGGVRTPWVSVAPRGNGIARLDFFEGEATGIEAFELIRGESAESREILDLGDAFMADLVSAALDKAGEKGERTSAPADAIVEAVYWYPFGCRDCEDFLWDGVPEIEEATGTIIEIEERDTGDPDDFEALLSALDERGTGLRLLPVLIAGDGVYQGSVEIEEGVRSLAAGRGVGRGEDGGIPGPAGPEGDGGSGARWEPGAVFVAGLLDGVNPCAFSAMVFLVSALALAGRTKRSMIVTGISYAVGVFATYSLIGAGLLGGLRSLAISPSVGRILEFVLAGFLAVLAVLSVADGIKLSSGRTDLLLKLPKGLSAKAHLIIRKGTRSGAAGGGAFLLGAAVALVELGCTGQVYLPTIAWMIARGEGARPWIWLSIYNTAFIIPLLAVFVVSYKGVSAVRMAEAFKRNGSVVKYATAALFVVLAVVILAT